MVKNPMNYELTHIALKNLSVVWRKAQRTLDEKWAKQIADNFDPELFEPVMVTQPNGEGVYHIVEGQHRTQAARFFLNDLNQMVPCRVIGEADPARAAEIWLGINKGRKKVRPVVEFLVAVEAGREVEVACNNIIKKAGYIVIEYAKGDNALVAVGAACKVYKMYGATTLGRTLYLCRQLWGTDPAGVRSPLIRGFGMFINEFHTFDINHLVKVITAQYKSPWKFWEASVVDAERSSQNLDVAISELVRVRYNKGIRDPSKRLHRKASK